MNNRKGTEISIEKGKLQFLGEIILRDNRYANPPATTHCVFHYPLKSRSLIICKKNEEEDFDGIRLVTYGSWKNSPGKNEFFPGVRGEWHCNLLPDKDLSDPDMPQKPKVYELRHAHALYMNKSSFFEFLMKYFGDKI